MTDPTSRPETIDTTRGWTAPFMGLSAPHTTAGPASCGGIGDSEPPRKTESPAHATRTFSRPVSWKRMCLAGAMLVLLPLVMLVVGLGLGRAVFDSTATEIFFLIPFVLATVIGLAATLLPGRWSAADLGWVTPAWSLWHLLWIIPATLITTTTATALVAGLLLNLEPTEEASVALFSRTVPTWYFALALCAVVAAPLVEEILFRRFLLGRIEQTLFPRLGPVAGPVIAIVVQAVIFGLFHVMPQVMVFAFFLGLICGTLARTSKSLWPSFTVHAVNNLIVTSMVIAAL